jgi:hypothetical protein
MRRDPKVIIVDTRNASDYERERIREIAEWKGRAPGTVATWMGRVAGPVDRAIRSALTEETVENALAEANRIAGKSLAERMDGVPETLEDADIRAQESRNWAIGYAAAGGAGAGAAGIVGLAVDIPFTITMSLRAVRRIGADYGYRDAEEADFALRTLAVAAANSTHEKEHAIAVIEKEAEESGSNTAASRGAVAKEGTILATRSLAAALARNLVGRKAAQAIPVVGAAIGAAASASFLDDVCTAARHLYQERYLRDRAILDNAIG